MADRKPFNWTERQKAAAAPKKGSGSRKAKKADTDTPKDSTDS